MSYSAVHFLLIPRVLCRPMKIKIFWNSCMSVLTSLKWRHNNWRIVKVFILKNMVFALYPIVSIRCGVILPDCTVTQYLTALWKLYSRQSSVCSRWKVELRTQPTVYKYISKWIISNRKDYNGMATSKGCQWREYQN